MVTFWNTWITYQCVWPSFLLFQQIFVTESITHGQRLVSMLEQNFHIGPSQTEQQSLLKIDTCETAGGTQAEEDTHEWGDSHEDELPDYSARIFWEPDSDSEGGGDTKMLSFTTEKIVKNAFCHSLKPDKKRILKESSPSQTPPLLRCLNSTPSFNQGCQHQPKQLTRV